VEIKLHAFLTSALDAMSSLDRKMRINDHIFWEYKIRMSVSSDPV
jgi:hypothetical protein